MVKKVYETVVQPPAGVRGEQKLSLFFIKRGGKAMKLTYYNQEEIEIFNLPVLLSVRSLFSWFFFLHPLSMSPE